VKRGHDIPKHDAERALKVMEYERKTEPKYRRPGSAGSCLVFALALLIAGAIVFYIITHKEQFARLWQRSTRPDTIPTQIGPDQGP
jgi:hypothetical protein